MRIRRITGADDDTGAVLAQLGHCDFSFSITEEWIGPFDADHPGRTAAVVPPGTKRYDFDVDLLASHIGGDEHALFVAELDRRPVAYLAVSKGWNRYAVVDDLAVDASCRRMGAARRLMDEAVKWAANAGLPGVCLETQSNNVAACRFYARYGFVLGGHDRHLYRALHPGTREVALFWYLFL